MDVVQTWADAACSFAELVRQLPPNRWDEQALGEWSLLDLLGHTVSAGVREVLAAVGRPAQREDVTTAAGYYALAQSVDPAIYETAVAASGADARRTGAELGSDPAPAVQDMVDQATARLDGIDPEALVTTAGGGMRLGIWLPTRTFELAVHSLDIASATGLEAGIPDEVIADAAALAARTAVATGQGRTVLLALTGRGHLPSGFSVV